MGRTKAEMKRVKRARERRHLANQSELRVLIPTIVEVDTRPLVKCDNCLNRDILRFGENGIRSILRCRAQAGVETGEFPVYHETRCGAFRSNEESRKKADDGDGHGDFAGGGAAYGSTGLGLK